MGRCGRTIHGAWRRFLRGHGPSTLVIDATSFDTRALGSAAVLERAPWLLAEGVLIAVGLRGSATIEVRLPAELTGNEAPFLNAADASARWPMSRWLSGGRHPADCKPPCWAEASDDDRSRWSTRRDLVPHRAAVRRRIGPQSCGLDASC